MKFLYRSFLFIYFFLPVVSSAQSGMWTWMHGSQTTGYTGNYGTQGVSSATNAPSARYRSAFWKDLNGNFWLFGGKDYNNALGYNDLWKFDVKLNEWTWVHGPQNGTNPAGNPGIRGVSSSQNVPSAYGIPSSWTGEDGYLYLYSASLYGDDMWRYDITNNEWTWIAGEANGIAIIKATHGTKGVPAPTNTPGKRELAQRYGWVYDNKLWLFGGQKYFANSVIPGNDLWSFDLNTNEWTWVSGDQSPPYNGNYGTLNVPNATNSPPGRWALCNWLKSDTLFLFGGWRRNDLWSFNITTNEWTWIGGTQGINDGGNVTENCKFNKQFNPHGNRLEGQFAQSSICATNHWVFGGSSIGWQNFYNDLWVYNSDSLSWNQVWGNNTTPVPPSYGILGQASTTNALPARDGAAIWVDDDNNIWVFGGMINNNNDIVGDMWKFTPDTNCIKIEKQQDSTWTKEFSICKYDTLKISFPPNANVSCEPASSSYYDKNSSFLYLFPTVEQDYSIHVTTTACDPKELGTVHIKHLNNPTATFELTPKITTINSPVFSTQNYSTHAQTYKWYVNNSFVSTQHEVTQSFTETGEYCFTLIAENDCGADTTEQCGEIHPDIYIPNAFSPNQDGNNDLLKIISNGNVDLIRFSIYNRWGQQIFQTTDWKIGWDGKFNGVDCEIGVYYYLIEYRLIGTHKQLRGDISLLR